ncbi:G-protein coupled receptor 35-like [Elgaria multicarinata webbii]|uniref:G-protein coupled receptor 35-like n=1 Tax=Elgaria multicarinata webbii TaxID=159646 RepID=UPI002FCCCE14
MENCSSNIMIDKNIVTSEIILYSLVTFFGIIFNTVALWVFCFRLHKWTETRVYMINLAIADYTLVLTLPFITYFHYHRWTPDELCTVVFAVHSMNTPMSISNITLIALDRYIAIKHPLKAKVIRSPQKAAITCLFFWLCCLLYMITLVVSFEKEKATAKEKERLCFYKTSVNYSIHIPIKFIIFFLLPLVILLFCSIQIILCLKKKPNTSLQEKKLTQKAIRVVSVNMGTFILCFLPFHISLLAQYALDSSETDCNLRQTIIKTTHATSFMMNLNCCLDAICYYLVAKEFQEAASVLPPFKSMQSRSN